jgi:hypothetical protein
MLTPADIRAARLAAGLTQAQAAALCYRTTSCWQSAELGRRNLDRAAWEVFQRKARAIIRKKAKAVQPQQEQSKC